MIDERIIEQILDRADIVDVISGYVDLKKKGVNYQACCLSIRRRPQFLREPGTRHLALFRMWQGRQRRRFLMEHETMSYPEAVRHLGKKYGITVEEERLTPEQEQARMKRESMFVINQRCAEHFRQNLLDPANNCRRISSRGAGELE